MADSDLAAIQARLDAAIQRGAFANRVYVRDVGTLLDLVANQAAELAFWKDEEPHPSQLVHDLAGVDGYEGCRGGACVCMEDEG